MSIFRSIFSPTEAPVAPAAPVVAPVVVPVAPTPEPLDEYKDLWTVSAEAPKPAPLFDVKPEELDRLVGGLDFMQGQSNQDLAQKALAGDSNALAALLNSSGRAVTKTLLGYIPHIITAAVDKKIGDLNQSLPGQIRAIQATDQIVGEDARFSHNGVKPLIDDLQKRFGVSYPNASAQEINKMARNYLASVSALVAAPASVATQANDSVGFDFSTFN